jgi:hypothetical protein
LQQGKGLFELVDYRYASAFQGLYDHFVQEACNFVQVGRYYRFWTDIHGALRVIVVSLFFILFCYVFSICVAFFFVVESPFLSRSIQNNRLHTQNGLNSLIPIAQMC